MARFEKGHKLAKGGKREGAGRPSNQQKEIAKAAAEIAKDYIERSVKPVMLTYFQLAHGRIVNKWHEGKIVGQEFEADAATTRHFVDKLVPTSKQEPDGDPQARPIYFVQFNALSQGGLPSKEIVVNGERTEQSAIEAQVWARPNGKLSK